MGGQDRADASNLLIPGKVLLLLPRLVPLVGLNEAIVLQQVRFLTAPDRAPADEAGRRWIRLSYASWQERHFPFWGCDTIKRAFRTLEAEGFLLSERPQRAARDQTKAYAIDYRRLDELERALRAAAIGTVGGHAPGRGRRVATDQAGAAALPASNLLLDDHPLVIIPRLAVLIGLDEAIALQQVRYWLADARSPRVHEGRRWVRFTHQEWASQIPRSPRTLGTIFRQLESSGFLMATTCLNMVRGDQTRWYTIDFDALIALEDRATGGGLSPLPDDVGIADGKSAPLETADLRDSIVPQASGKDALIEVAIVHLPNGNGAALESARMPGGGGNPALFNAATLPDSLKGRETKQEIPYEIQQHEHQRVTYSDGVVAENVSMVQQGNAEPNAEEDLAAMLTHRGITRMTARELAARWPMRVAPQIAIYDWLRAGDAMAPHYHPGRLRRMIEEDWAPPPEFLARAERESFRAARRVSDAPEKGGMLVSPAGTAELGDVLARQLGVRAADQGVWQAIIGSPPGFPPFLRQALFCPPPAGTRTAAVIFPDEQTYARAAALSPAIARRVAMSIATRYRLPFAEIAFFTRAALLAQVQAGDR